MPLFLEPGQQYPIVLDIDAGKPKESQPTFFAKSQSMRGQQKIGEVLDLWSNSPDISLADLFDATIAVLDGVVVGWKNMGSVEFSTDSMKDVLNYSEARELLRKVMYNQHITPDEKKSLESRP
jgi:hypothetical protein